MKIQISYFITLYIFLSLFQITYTETLELPKPKLEKIKSEFKTISQIIFKLGQSKIPNQFSKDIESINQILNGREITEKNIQTILTKLTKIKADLLERDPESKVSIPTGLGRFIEKPLGNFLAIDYKEFSSDLKTTLETGKKIVFVLNEKDLKLLRDSFKPIFWGFYDLYEHRYYKYLETVRRALHFNLNKEKLVLIRDIMNLLLNDLNDENQNQTMMLETSAYQKFNLTMRDFKELIKKFINIINPLIK